ncbi:MAG: PilN domain-containing protein [Xanthomonadaceae bacterium]|jgi:type IV pilus assembly protein PilN|nr:PilN domain-containing protein [Xanthomonadaceae bacterium]
MARINLLSWRDDRRKQRQRDFYGALGLSALVGLLLSIVVIVGVKGQISGQNGRNQFLRGEIVTVDRQIAEIEQLDRQKERLLARKRVIEELQANRSQMVHLFDSLVRTIPDGVMLTTLKQDGTKLTLEGRTQSTALVSTYMRNLEGSGWMTRPELSIIEAKTDEKSKAADAGLPFMFTLTVTLSTPSSDQAKRDQSVAQNMTVGGDSSSPDPSMSQESAVLQDTASTVDNPLTNISNATEDRGQRDGAVP